MTKTPGKFRKLDVNLVFSKVNLMSVWCSEEFNCNVFLNQLSGFKICCTERMLDNRKKANTTYTIKGKQATEKELQNHN